LVFDWERKNFKVIFRKLLSMTQPKKEKSFLVLLREKMADWAMQYFEWLKLRPNLSLFQKLLHLLTRIIASIFVIALSPIVFLIVFITFFAAG